MKPLNFKGKWVLVTGASSGLGLAIARYLAAREQANLIVTARRADRLEALKKELEAAYEVQVKVWPADLSLNTDVERLADFCMHQEGFYAAVLNAGVTYFGRNKDIAAEQLTAIINTNVAPVVTLTNTFGKYFEEQHKEGGILIVASLAACIPAPYQAVYSGSKGFLLNYANAFACELENKDFSITVFLPGGIKTEMTADAKFRDLSGWLMDSGKAAHLAVHALKNRKFNCIPGAVNRLGFLLSHFLPKKFFLRQMGQTYKKSLLQAE